MFLTSIKDVQILNQKGGDSMRYAVVAINYLFKDLPEYVLYVFDGYTRKEVISDIIAKGLYL